MDVITKITYDGMLTCSFNSDVNSCNICNDIEVNGCPDNKFDDDTLDYRDNIPKLCPLLKGDVVVKLGDTND